MHFTFEVFVQLLLCFVALFILWHVLFSLLPVALVIIAVSFFLPLSPLPPSLSVVENLVHLLSQ